jgi:hypothetical protein
MRSNGMPLECPLFALSTFRRSSPTIWCDVINAVTSWPIPTIWRDVINAVTSWPIPNIWLYKAPHSLTPFTL